MISDTQHEQMATVHGVGINYSILPYAACARVAVYHIFLSLQR